jgi:hypothetical protein
LVELTNNSVTIYYYYLCVLLAPQKYHQYWLSILDILFFNNILEIKSDSQLIINYWSKNHINKYNIKKMDKDKYNIIIKCAEYRKKYEFIGGKIIKISGDKNLADLFGHCKISNTTK